MAKSSLHDTSSIVLKTIRSLRKNYTISHIPIRKPSMTQNLTLDQEVSHNEEIKRPKTPVEEKYSSGSKKTRRRVLPLREWSMASENPSYEF